jgi:adenylate cyclase
MRDPMGVEAFAELARLPVQEIEQYRAAGLIDLDNDSRFDDTDVLRLQVAITYRELGYPPDQIADEVRRSSNTVIRRLFGDAEHMYSLEQAAERIGLSAEQLTTLQTAVGLGVGWYDEDDVEALCGIRRLLDGGVPWDGVVEASRVYGDVSRRLAESDMQMLHRFVCEPLAERGLDQRQLTAGIYQALDAFVPLSDQLMRHLHEDYLLRASVRHALDHLVPAATGGQAGAFEAVILFVDLTLFTSLTELHGDEEAAELLERFDTQVRDLAVRYDGSLVKQIGDAFMLTFADPVDAVRFALGLAKAARAEPLPPLRFGIHAGPVLYRVGDYVGNTVNLASRVAAMATPDTILVTEGVARAAVEAGIPSEDVGVREARGLGDPVSLYRIVAGTPTN